MAKGRRLSQHQAATRGRRVAMVGQGGLGSVGEKARIARAFVRPKRVLGMMMVLRSLRVKSQMECSSDLMVLRVTERSIDCPLWE